MKKKITKFLLSLMAFAMIFTFNSFSAFADTANSASYYVGNVSDYATTGTINATVIVESRNAGDNTIDKTIPVQLNANGTSTSFTVRDALLAVQSGNNGISFNDYSGRPLTNTSTFFATINSITSIGGQSGMDGIVFRVNDKFPLESASWGATIATTYIKNGDVIHVYHDDPTDNDSGARYTRISNVNTSGNMLNVTVQESHQYYTSTTWDWVLSDFTAYEDAVVNILNNDGNIVMTKTTVANGKATFDISSLDSGSYTIKVKKTYKSNTLIENTSCEYSFAK